MKVSQQYLGYNAKYSFFNLKSQKLEFRLKIISKSVRFSEAILISFVMLYNEKRRFVIKKLHEIHVG